MRIGVELITGDTGKDEVFEVLSSQVGFRPGRKEGLRVEVKEVRQVGDIWTVRSHGNGGAGYQNSVGSAEQVVRLVEGLE